ncbi:autotransporter-associated beta strand repeat-containing protein, partial [Jatrophihabitans endophyticus]|uniref:beta strand repeat-containing protein n=1 Tax=Jatrophihabitans endophyticus TaxID=1206085 RepID=UPI001A03C637
STWTLSGTAGTTLAYQVAAGTLDLGGFDQAIGSLAGENGGIVTNSGSVAAVLTAGGDNTSTAFAGVLQNTNGTLGLIKTGAGTLTLTGANTYTGGTTLTAGTLSVGVDTVGAPGAITSSAIGTGTLTFTGGTLRAGGAYTLANAATVNMTGGTIDTNNNRFTLSGPIGGPGALTVVNSTDTGDLSGVLALTGTNTYAGGTTVTSSVVELSNSTVVGGAVQSSSIGTGTLTLASDNTGPNGPSAQLRATANNLTLGNDVVLGGNDGGAFDTGANTLVITGQVSGGGFGSLQKLGTGTLVLAHTNTYTGATQVTAGMLKGGATDAFGVNSPVYLENNTTLDLGGYDQSIGSLSDSNFNGLTDGSSRVTNSGTGLNTLTVGGDGFSQTFSGAIVDGTGQIALTKVGTSTQTLAGANTYSGATMVTGGTLKAGATNAFSPNSAVSVGAAGTLDVGGFAQTIGSLAGDAGAVVTNSRAAASVLTTGGNNASTTYAGTIEDGAKPLGLVKTGTGVFTLTGTNTFSSGTHVEGGTLALGNADAAGSGDVSLDRGTTLAFTDSFRFANNIVFTQTGDPMIDTGANTDTITGVISGPGDLDKLGSGTLILAGTNTYTGATIVSAGTLLVTGSAAASTATVDNGATLGGAGTIGGLVVQAGGTVAPGAGTPYSTLTVAGNVTFDAGSTFAVNITPAGQTDSIATTGTATLNGGTVAVNGGTGIYSTSAVYPILTATGGRTGTFANLTTTTNLA